MRLTDHVRQQFSALLEQGDDYTSLARDAGVTRNAMKGAIEGTTDKIAISVVERFCEARDLDFFEFVGGRASTVDADLLLGLIQRILIRMDMQQSASEMVAGAILRAYELARQHGVRPENEPALLSIADAETRELRP